MSIQRAGLLMSSFGSTHRKKPRYIQEANSLWMVIIAGVKRGFIYYPKTQSKQNSVSCILILPNSSSSSASVTFYFNVPISVIPLEKGNSSGSNECAEIVFPGMMKAVRLYMGCDNCSPHCLSKEQSCWEQQILRCYIRTH